MPDDINANPELTKDDSFFKKRRKDFIYGLIVILPIAITIWLVLLAIDLVSGPVSALFGQRIPSSLSFVISMFVITVIGVLAQNFIGRLILRYVEGTMVRIPLINTIYRAMKQVVNAFSFSNKNFLGAVLVEYPRKGLWAMGFLTQDEVVGLRDKDGQDLGQDMVAVFMPTTPNPTSGYFIYVPRSDVRELDISLEESIKVLMSAGVLTPS